MIGQYEVYIFLKNKRECGDEHYFTVSQIQYALKEQGCSDGQLKNVWSECIKLLRTNYLESKVDNKDLKNWNRGFRIKLEYCKK